MDLMTIWFISLVVGIGTSFYNYLKGDINFAMSIVILLIILTLIVGTLTLGSIHVWIYIVYIFFYNFINNDYNI